MLKKKDRPIELIELNILLCLCDRTADTIETHGYYQHGTGFPAVNGAPKLQPFGANLPIKVLLPHFFGPPKWRCREVSKKEGLRKCMDLYDNFNVASTALGLQYWQLFPAFGKSILNYGQYAGPRVPEKPKRSVFLGWPFIRGWSYRHTPSDELQPAQVDAEETGLGHRNIFGSEFGAVVMSSFESMAPTLAPEHWGLHGGQKEALRQSCFFFSPQKRLLTFLSRLARFHESKIGVASAVETWSVFLLLFAFRTSVKGQNFPTHAKVTASATVSAPC